MTPATVVMAGPLPPAVGGMSSVIGALAESSLAERVQLRLFETGKTTPEGRSLWQGIRSRMRVMRAWWSCLDAPQPLVAHIHTCSGFTYFLDGALLLLARLRGSATVLHVHGGRFDSFLDHLDPARRALARWIARRAHVVVVLSDDWCRRLSSRLPGARFAVVRNGVAAGPEREVATRHPDRRFLFLGSVSRGKGVHVLVEAVSRSRGRWCVDLVGPEGEPGALNEVREALRKLGLGERVAVHGSAIGSAKARFVDAADAFVLPSLAEGLPVAMLEAMAAGLPVVVTAVGAVPEVIHDGVEGLMVPPGDARALAEALDRMASDDEMRSRMGRNARQLCLRRFGVESMVDALVDVYRELGVRVAR